MTTPTASIIHHFSSIEDRGDYVLSLKGNQGSLYDDVKTYFESSLLPEIKYKTKNILTKYIL